MADTESKINTVYVGYVKEFARLMCQLLRDDEVDLWRKEIVVGTVNKTTEAVNTVFTKIRANCHTEDWAKETETLAQLFEAAENKE